MTIARKFRFVVVLLTVVFSTALAGERVAAADDPADAAELDLSTPRRAVGAFLAAAEHEDWDRATRILDLRAIPPASRLAAGQQAARDLAYVLDRIAWVEVDLLSDEPGGNPSDGAKSERIASARVGRHEVMITLARGGGGAGEWRFSSATVAQIPKLYEEHGPGAVERRVPAVLRDSRAWGLAVWQWLALPIILMLALTCGAVTAAVVRRAGKHIARRTATAWDDALTVAFAAPVRYFVAALAFRFLLEPLGLSAAATHVFGRLVGIATIATIAWLAIRAVAVLARWLEAHARSGAEGAAERELQARGFATQVRVFRRVINVGVALLAAALMLVQFELVRNIGVSLLASAGLAGVVLGFAAQRTFGSLIAGIQLSMTQPIRIGDVVIVEKEWGTIEEITLTYVVVRVWDERRLIVPMSRFLEQPFENWTKTSAELHGTVFVNVDWTLPVDALRAELDRILDGHPAWDGRTKKVVVTDARERTLEVRILVSAADADKLWDLRVDIRERVVRWLRELEGGRYLPRLRYAEEPNGAHAPDAVAPPLSAP